MTFTMLPMGRSVLRPMLHKIVPVAASAKAAPFTLMPEGPIATADMASAACLAQACLASAICAAGLAWPTERIW